MKRCINLFFIYLVSISLISCGFDLILTPVTVTSVTAVATTPLSAISSLISAKFELSFSCALTSAGAVLCWGDNSSGQLGDGTQILRSSAVPVTGLSSGVTQISLGNAFGMALVNGSLQAWGVNTHYSLGDGTQTTRLAPAAVLGLSGVSSEVFAGGYFACSLQSGAAYCWGQNENGQLGRNSTLIGTAPAIPTTVSAFTQLAVGLNHACGATTSTGKLYCWGDNSLNQLGDGTGAQHNAPTAASILTAGVTDLSAGRNHTCAIQSGIVYCWGANNFGQLGLGTVTIKSCTTTAATLPCVNPNASTSTNPIQPLAVTGVPSGALKVYSGANHSCALFTGGDVYCWGRNDWGQLGTGAISASTGVPALVTVTSQRIRSVAPGILHTCVVLSDYSVQCWGHNSFGELGNGTTTSSVTAVSAVQ